ncbi:MAG: hypothetical protein JWQ52_1628 [Phenylobacterium sp.]|jgi:hypothetical protein|nr:hypothetical protein [Phenylobacterium sp.]
MWHLSFRGAVLLVAFALCLGFWLAVAWWAGLP